MTSTDPSSIETIAYLGCGGGGNRLSRLELLQQQQQQQFHLSIASSAAVCEHNCNCTMHQHQPLGNHHHHGNFSSPTNVPAAAAASAASNGPFSHHNHHFNHNHLNQHMHPFMGQQQQQQQQQLDGNNLIYNNSSTNSECNQPVHYIPTSNLSVASQQHLNIPNMTCDCGHGQHIPPHHHQRQSSTEQSHSLHSGQSSRIISCDENNPSGTEDGSGMSSSGMALVGCRASKRNL